MSKKRWAWWKKLAISVLGVFFIGLAGIGALVLWGMFDTMLRAMPREYTFSSIVKINREQRLYFQELLEGVEIPESARDIYIWILRGRDSILFARLRFPSIEEARRFAEDFLQTPTPEFRDGKTSVHGLINDGPPVGREFRAPPLHWWNLEEVERSIFYEGVVKHDAYGYRIWTPDSDRFVVIDLDTNNVYLCIQD
jgi:hypothetical protein